MSVKPLNRKAYGSIPHLICSRRGPADRGVNPGQHRICTEALRDKHDTVIVQVKLDGSNVAIAKVGGKVVPLTRAGYVADTSPYQQHHLFAAWVRRNPNRFASVLGEGDWISGEWLAQAHGTRYDLTAREPFVAFDYWHQGKRLPHAACWGQLRAVCALAPTLHIGGPCSIDAAMWMVNHRCYGELDTPEGAVWRVERTERGVTTVDFLAKYVQPGKIDGCYLPEVSGGEEVWNWTP